MSFKDTLWSGALKLGGLAYDYLRQNNNNNINANSPIVKTLKQKLNFCTYEKNIIPQIIQFSMQFFNHYPNTEIQIKTFEQGYNNICSVLEYKIVAQVYKGESKYPVECRILISKHFPNQPPILRIVNIDVNRYQTNPFYQQSTSKVEGNSYILNPLLISVKSWNRYDSKIINVVNDSISIMSSHFPFYKKTQQNSNANNDFGFGQGYNNNNQNNKVWNNLPQTNQNNNYNSPPPYSSNTNNNNNGWGFDNNFSNKVNQPSNQWQSDYSNKVNQNSQNSNNNSNWFATKQLNAQQTKLKQQLDIYITQAVSLKQQIQLMVKCNNRTQKQYDHIQTTSILNQLLTRQIDKLSTSIDKMKQLIKTSEKLQLEQINLIDLVQPTAGLTTQLLDLIAENKAQHDMYVFLENKFSNDEINLETFMRLGRKVEEEKFMTKFMIKKVVEAINGGKK